MIGGRMKEPSDSTFLLSLYRTMLQIRLCEESFVEPILSGEIKCPVHLYSGQEAIAAGVCAALEPRDYVFGNHRSHGHYLAKGGDLRKMVAEIFCRQDGCAGGRGGSMHVIDESAGVLGAAPIVAGTVSLAVGAAYATRVKGDGRVAVSFFGDGAAGEGVLYESLNLASIRRLPVLFVCENNSYATHLPIRECRVSEEIVKVAEPFGVWARRMDGNDVLEVYRVAREAVNRCRNGEGPAFMECVTYRLRGHVGPDDNIQGSHTDIRPPEEITAWRARDPIPRFEAHLLAKTSIAVDDLAATRMAVEQEVAEAMTHAKQAAFPNPASLNRGLFHEP